MLCGREGSVWLRVKALNTKTPMFDTFNSGYGIQGSEPGSICTPEVFGL
jgi:hypothetical protein